MSRIILISFLMSVILAMEGPCHAQETIFALLKSDERRADEFFEKRNYNEASKYYSVALKREKASREIYLKLARSNFNLKNFHAAIVNFNLYQEGRRMLSKGDVLMLGESYTSLGAYTKAIQVFKDYIANNGEDPIIVKKVWRLSNAEYLYEDSLHYSVSPIANNTASAEISPRPFKDGILFLSNRKQLRVIEKLNPESEPFFGLYFSRLSFDSALARPQANRISKLQSGLQSRFNIGGFWIYDNDSKMVYSRNLDNEIKTLGLWFAELESSQWAPISEFPYNSAEYSISDPWISKDGDVLYFSSDMPGGFGGRDIYQSVLENGVWTKPVNVGEPVNSGLDEVSPYYRDNALYFSSNGHAGLGGLDIFKAERSADGFEEPVNMGYPINSTDDDFSIVINSAYTGGMFSSNRIGKGKNDDNFEFEMDLQTYPVIIEGHLRYKDHLVEDTTQIRIFRNAKMSLIDANRNITVFESLSDDDGRFSLTIPYFAKYKIKVVGSDGNENIVSLEIPKHRKDYGTHDIVVVKDVFRQNNEK